MQLHERFVFVIYYNQIIFEWTLSRLVEEQLRVETVRDLPWCKVLRVVVVVVPERLHHLTGCAVVKARVWTAWVSYWAENIYLPKF